MTVAVQSLQNRQEFKLDPDQELQRGLQARRSGDRALAKDIFAGVVAQFPGHTWARYELVQELRFEGSVGEATTVAEDALKYPGVSPQLLGTLADLLGEACEFEKQRLFLEMAAEKFATRAYPWIHMSKSLAARDEMEGAFDALHRGFTRCIDREQKDLVAEQHGRLASTVHMHCLKFDAWPPKAGAEIKNACVVQLIKDEEDILGDQLEHNYLLGFRYFCVIDNNSTDGTRGVIDEFRKRADVYVVVISDHIFQYYQDFKTTAAAKFAVEYFSSLGVSIDWIVPLDADEFISFSSADISFADILENAGQASIVTFPLINCASEVPLEYYKHGDVYNQFPLVDGRSIRGEVKCIYRFTSESRLFVGNHFVRNRVVDLADIYPATRLGAYYRHYPYRSVAHTRSKVINGYKSIVAFPDVKGGAHWRQNWELYNKHGEPWLSRYLERYIERVREQAS